MALYLLYEKLFRCKIKYIMLIKTYTKTVMKRKNQNSGFFPKEKKFGLFKCDKCSIEFEVENNLLRKITTKHHFCSAKCQAKARKKGGCLNYIYSLFENPFKKIEIQQKIKKTMIEHYGYESCLSSKIIREKCKKTMVERYGAENSMNCPSIIVKYDFEKITQKRHLNMKENKTYRTSKPENELHALLCKHFSDTDVERSKFMNKKWPIDFYVKSLNVYIQLDGVYWHGLNRPLEKIMEFKTPRDKIIYRKYLTDREQEKWFKEQGLKLIRITDKQFISDPTSVFQLLVD